MTNLSVLKTLVTQMLARPVNVRGFTEIYPTPEQIFGDCKIKWNRSHAIIGMDLENLELLYSGKGSLNVYAYMLQTPQECLICGEEASQVAAIEATGPAIKGYKNVRIYSPDFSADKLWEAIQRNRYWLTVPVCGQHKPDAIRESVSLAVLVVDDEEKRFNLKLINKTWAGELIQLNRSQVRYAAYKAKSMLEKRRIGSILAVAGGVTTIFSIITALDGVWFWLIPTLLILGLGLYLLFSEKSEILVAYESKPGEKKLNFLKGVIGLGSTIGVFGLMTLFLKVNGEQFLGSIPVGVKLLGTGLGFVIAFVASYFEGKLKE